MKFKLSAINCTAAISLALAVCAEAQNYSVFVSNERSGDVSVIAGATDVVVATFKVGKRPRGIHATPDGQRLFVTLSGSPRMAPGIDENRAPADKSADGLGVIDPVAHKLIDRWHVGSDPEQFAISKDGRFAIIANEDDASASIVDLGSGQSRGKIKVSEEPEGVGVNPRNGEVYVSTGRGNAVAIIDTQKNEVPRSPLPSARGEGEGEESIVAMIPVGNRAWAIALDPSGSKLYKANGASNDVSVVDLKSRKELRRIKVGDGPWGIAIVSK